ncbi:MAG TPA: M23 family metallopeptidase [Nitrospira sp.]|nr:M23 family metallopeptidase [Nitrospira sp.]
MLYPNGTTTKPKVSSPFGPRKGSSQNGFHYGTDYIGFPDVHSIAAGTVTLARYLNDQAGNTVAVDIAHGNGTTTTIVYMHLATINVKVGQSVSEGQILGAVGQTGNATGPCCHLEVRIWIAGKCHWQDSEPWLAARVGVKPVRLAMATCNIRKTPSTALAPVGKFAAGTRVQPVGYVHGQTVENNACWYKLDSGYYVWTGGFVNGAGGVAGVPFQG